MNFKWLVVGLLIGLIPGVVLGYVLIPPVTVEKTVDRPIPGNQSPQAQFSVSSAEIFPGDLVKFDASASRDNDGSIKQFSWDFGDGQTASGIRVSHVFESAGNYLVKLVVVDDKDSSAQALASVLAQPRPFPPPLISAKLAIQPESPTSSLSWNTMSASLDQGEMIHVTLTILTGGPVSFFVENGEVLFDSTVEHPEGITGEVEFTVQVPIGGIYIFEVFNGGASIATVFLEVSVSTG